MAYLDIISLADAKNYLRVDDDLTDDDAQITSMIKSSLAYVERYTNHILFAREKTYLFQDCEVRVYDYPINSVTSPTEDLETEEKTLYNLYNVNSSSTTNLVLNVGYSDVDDVPDELIQIAYNLIKYYYYEAETDKANRGRLPQWLLDSMNQYKRYLL